PIVLQSTFALTSSAPELSADLALDGTVAYDDGGSANEISPLRLSGNVAGPNVPQDASAIEMTSSVSIDLEEETLSIPDLDLASQCLRLRAGVEGQEIQSDAARFLTALDLSG